MTVIAMTREIGSHGSEVAAGVAAALGLEIINSEIVVPHVAGSLGVEQSAVQRYLDGKASLLDRWQIDTRKLSQHTLDQILNLALKDNVLIRGWGAAALFQGISGVICVRVCAPMALRVRVTMERLGVKDAEAIQQEIERFDAGHSRAMRAAFNFDWNDALLYDIVLNSSRVTIDRCIKAVCDLAQHQRSQDDSETKAALADKLLEAKINSALSEHISVTMAPNGIAVSVADGKVTLAGTCSNGAVRSKAEKAARGIAGVVEINNRIISVPSRGSGY
jgi:cytidylate kinase